jgi:alanine-glyoxylate transaminase/(R)-3-amino-2-methylpropionate-pyruvate transaminase
MQHLCDDAGGLYLDGFAGILSVSVGHCHPRSSRRSAPRSGRSST